ncbi:Ig-like domain-containing protein, partial [Limnohabitans sp.]|uniref:beta strand repeat-containing protein n=1 Tax=Limnohabitans sp. TaxID=1907725 RepID=UPI00286F0A59
MAKRTPSPQAKAAELHTMPAQDVVTMNEGNAQPLPAVVKSSGKSKAKAKLDTVRDDDPLAADQDPIATASSEHSLTDNGHDVVLAQANTSGSTSSAPASVGEDLLRQAGPIPTKTANTQDTGFFSSPWVLPVAIGGGALALAGGGGGSGSNTQQPVAVAETTSFTVVPYAGKFIDSTTNLTAKLYKVSASGVETEIGNSTVVKNGSMSISAKNTDLVLDAGEYLKVKLIDNTMAPDFLDEAQTDDSEGASGSAKVNLGHELTTLLSAAPKAGGTVAVTQLTTLATLKFDELAAATKSADIKAAIDTSNNTVKDAFSIQTSLTDSNPANSSSYQKALGLISGYAKSLGATPADSKTSEVLDALKAAISKSSANEVAAAIQSILQTGVNNLPPDYTNPNGSSPFVVSSLELTDTTTPVNGQPTVNLVNYNDGLTFKINPGTGTRVGDKATLTFTDKDSGAKFTYVYTFKGNSVDGTEPGNEIYSAETITIPRFSNLNLAALAEYTDANGNTLLPLTNGHPDGAIHRYSVDLRVGTLGVGKGLSDFGLNTASVTLSNPALEGSTVFGTTDTLTVNVALTEKVAWANGNPTLKLHIADGYDISLQLLSGFTGTGSTVPTNVLTFQVKLKDIGSHSGPISIAANAIEFPAGATIMNSPGGIKDATWFNTLVDTTLTPALNIDTVLPSTAYLKAKTASDVVVLDADQANKSNLNLYDRVTQKNQLALNVTVEDQDLTGTGATVRLFWSRNSDGTSLVALGTKAVTDGNPVVSFDVRDYQEIKSGKQVPTYIGGATGPNATGTPYYLYTQVVDAAGNVGPLSSFFKVVLDNTAPTAPTLDLATASDTGQLTNDNITAVSKPNITVTGEKGAKVTLFDDTNSNGEVDAGETLSEGFINTTLDTDSTNKYSYSWTPATNLSAGTHHLKAKLTDVAGNTSLSSALDVEVLAPLTTKPSLAFVSAPTAGASYNMVTASQKTITATVTYERAMYVAADASTLTLTLNVGGVTRTATYSGISEDRKTLTFSYTLGSSSNNDSGLSGQVSITALNRADTLLSDIAGNPAPSGVTPFSGTAPTIDTLAPALPTIAIKDAQADLTSVTTDGAVAIKAEADATVTVTFKNTSDTTKAAQTVVVTGKGTGVNAEEVLAKLSSSQVTDLGQGTIQVTAEAKDAMGNSSGTTTATSALSFTLDTVAPSVTSVSDATLAAVTKDNIVFTVKFSEPLAATPTANDFTVTNGIGTIGSVVVDGSNANSYRVTVIPKPNTPSGQVQLGLSASSTIQDAAGNKAADSLAKFSVATQAIDTQAPTVTAVTSSKASSVATGAFDFIVTFSEAMGPAAIAGNPLSTSNFAVTNGQVTSVTPVATKDGSVQYKVSVTPNAGVDAGPNANMVLSLVASAVDTDSYVADALGNLAVNAPLNVTGLGGSQAIDTLVPALPTINVKTAAANSSNAQAGAVAIKAEADATVTVTFKNTSDTTKAAQTVVVTGKGTGVSAEEVLAKLSSNQVMDLGQGTIQVTAEAKDAAKNSSGTTTTVSSFTLDTIAPTVRSISSNIAQLKSGGTATVTFTFSEDPGVSFGVDDVTVTGGTLSNITGTGTTRTATFSADMANLSGQQATIAVKADSYTDAALNLGAGLPSPASLIFVDTTAPTITGFTSTSSSGTYGIGRDISLRATASEAVGSAAYLDVTLNTNPAQTVRLTRNTTNTTLFEGTYRVNSGDTTSGLKVTSFTASGADGVGNAIATTLPDSTGSLGASLVIQGIAPAAPASFALSTASDTGVVGDYITTQTTPGFDFKGLVVGLTVKIYNGNTVVHSFVANSVEMSNVQLPSALSVGNYANLKVVQVDAIGNESTAVPLPTSLQIQSLTAKPAALSALTLDPTLDAQNQYQYENNITPNIRVLDNSTFLSAPKFQFSGGTVGNTALLFRDIDGDGAYNKDKDILLGTELITETSNSLHSISVNPTNALANTSPISQGYTEIKVVQQDATGQISDASNAALGAASGPRVGLGLIIYNTSLGSHLADLTGFALAESSTFASNTPTLTFNVRGTVLGAKVVITATQTLNGATKEITLPDTALTGAANAVNNLVVDVRGVEGTLSNFKAKQTWAGVTSTTAISNTGSTAPVILDHVVPTVAISIDPAQGALLSQGETRLVTFKFSEEVTDFDASDITVSSGTLTGLAQDNLDRTLWTATYQGAPGNTAPAYLFVGSGKFQDAAGNRNTDGADANNILNFQFRPSNHAPTGADRTFTVNEDSSTTLAVADFGFADASDTTPNALKSVIITTLPTAGTLKLNN